MKLFSMRRRWWRWWLRVPVYNIQQSESHPDWYSHLERTPSFNVYAYVLSGVFAPFRPPICQKKKKRRKKKKKKKRKKERRRWKESKNHPLR